MQPEHEKIRGIVVEAAHIYDIHAAACLRFQEEISGEMERAADPGSESGGDESGPQDSRRFHVVEVGPGLLQVGILDPSGRVHRRCGPASPASHCPPIGPLDLDAGHLS